MTKAQAEKHTAHTGTACAKQTRRCACGRTWTHYEPLMPGYRKAPKIESQCAECAPATTLKHSDKRRRLRLPLPSQSTILRA